MRTTELRSTPTSDPLMTQQLAPGALVTLVVAGSLISGRVVEADESVVVLDGASIHPPGSDPGPASGPARVKHRRVLAVLWRKE